MEKVVNSDEIKRRVEAIASEARAKGLDSLVILDPLNVYYASGFRTTLHSRFTALVIRVSSPGDSVLVVPSVDRRLALEPIWYPSLIERTEIYYEGAPADGPLVNAPGPLLDKVIRDGDVLGADLATATYGQVKMLTDRYPSSQLTDASEILHAVRRVKTELELAALTRANAIAVKAMESVRELLQKGMTELDLAGRLNDVARSEGADGFAYPTLIGFGPKSLAPHAPPTELTLQTDQIVTIAFGPTVSGYCADIVRTFFYGAPPAHVVNIGQQCVDVQAAALANVRSCARAGSLMEAATQVIQRYYPDAPVAGRAGHSLGLTVHETPSLTPDNDMPLEADMVLAVEPSAGPFAMEGIGLYRHCDVVHVTTEGYDLLTPIERGVITVPA